MLKLPSTDARKGVSAVRLLKAGARVHCKRLRNGREAGEPRMWLPDRDAPGLLLSRWALLTSLSASSPPSPVLACLESCR